MHFKDKMMKEGSWSVDEEINIMWNNMSNCIKMMVREIPRT